MLNVNFMSYLIKTLSKNNSYTVRLRTNLDRTRTEQGQNRNLNKSEQGQEQDQEQGQEQGQEQDQEHNLFMNI